MLSSLFFFFSPRYDWTNTTRCRRESAYLAKQWIKSRLINYFSSTKFLENRQLLPWFQTKQTFPRFKSTMKINGVCLVIQIRTPYANSLVIFQRDAYRADNFKRTSVFKQQTNSSSIVTEEQKKYIGVAFASSIKKFNGEAAKYLIKDLHRWIFLNLYLFLFCHIVTMSLTLWISMGVHSQTRVAGFPSPIDYFCIYTKIRLYIDLLFSVIKYHLTLPCFNFIQAVVVIVVIICKFNVISE